MKLRNIFSALLSVFLGGRIFVPGLAQHLTACSDEKCASNCALEVCLVSIGMSAGNYRCFIVLCAISALTSCKLRIVVPEGGSVTTSSGAYHCAVGEKCDIDVVDFYFDETFAAVPADGYAFKAWRKKGIDVFGNDPKPAIFSQLDSQGIGYQQYNNFWTLVMKCFISSQSSCLRRHHSS